MAGEILHNLQKTLDTTLESFLDLVGCDGGSVYTVRKNSDGEEILNFEKKDERLFSVIAGQAALAIENSFLLEEQERLIKGFVDACVTAIEARDPVTCGHSVRVSNYTVGLAEAVNRTDRGPLRQTYF